MNTHNTRQQGFTIIETLIALTLFSLAVAGVITVAVQGGLNIATAKNAMTANYLAQEGIELMRAQRDTMVLSASDPATGWGDFITQVTSKTDCSANPCDIDPTNPNVVFLLGGLSSQYLFYNDSITPTADAGYYSHDPSPTNTQTPFIRAITVVVPPGPPGTPTEIQIISTVTWMEGQNLQSVVMKENLFNWYAP